MAGTQRKTKQKQAIYDALAALDHPTATQVYERVHEEHPTVSRGTVFRGGGRGSDEGWVRERVRGAVGARWEVPTAARADCGWRCCGRVCDLPVPALAAVAAGSILGGFHVDGCEVQCTGICQDCSKMNMRQSAQIK